MKISIEQTFFTSSIVISILIGISSCAPLYVPNAVNVPIFSEKGEVQGAAYYGTSGFDAQLALAASDNIGLMINGSSGKSEYSKEFHKHSF